MLVLAVCVHADAGWLDGGGCCRGLGVRVAGAGVMAGLRRAWRGSCGGVRAMLPRAS
jgi:hypothetical protein